MSYSEAETTSELPNHYEYALDAVNDYYLWAVETPVYATLLVLALILCIRQSTHITTWYYICNPIITAVGRNNRNNPNGTSSASSGVYFDTEQGITRRNVEREDPANSEDTDRLLSTDIRR